MGHEVSIVVAAAERQDIQPPEWFKELGIKQQGIYLWRRMSARELWDIAFATTGKRGKQLQRFVMRRQVPEFYYIRLHDKGGKYLRPFSMDKEDWESMPWVS